jgi:hypothetical protein
MGLFTAKLLWGLTPWRFPYHSGKRVFKNWWIFGKNIRLYSKPETIGLTGYECYTENNRIIMN